MLNEEKQMLSLVWFDFFALWICPVLMAVFNGLLNTGCIALFGYGVRDNLSLPLVCSFLLATMVKGTSDEAVHLRNTSAELRLYVWNWMKIVLIAHVGMVFIHYVLWVVLALPFFAVHPDDQPRYNAVFVILFGLSLVPSLAYRWFLMPPVTSQTTNPNQPTVLRGTGLGSGSNAATKAWRGRKHP